MRRVVAEGNLRAVKATPLVAPRLGDEGGPMKIAWLATDGIDVKEGDVVVRFDPTDAREARCATARPTSTRRTRGSREENIKSNAAVAGRDTDADLARPGARRRRGTSRPRIRRSSRATRSSSPQVDETLAGAKKDHAEKAKAIERELSHSKARSIAVEQQKAKLAIAHAKTALESMEIRAPHDGMLRPVARLAREHAAQGRRSAVAGRSGVAEIPLLDAMEVEVFVLEVDGSGLAEGQPAEVVIEARPGRDVPRQGPARRQAREAAPARRAGAVLRGRASSSTRPIATSMKPGQRVHADADARPGETRSSCRARRSFDKDGEERSSTGAARPASSAVAGGARRGDVGARRRQVRARRRATRSRCAIRRAPLDAAGSGSAAGQQKTP